MINFLEQLVAEWYEFQGYFIRRNANVGKRPNGGYECELDVVAFHPGKQHLVHIEPSIGSGTWADREASFEAKFRAGKKYIPALFAGFPDLPEIEQMAIMVHAGKQGHPTVGGARLVLIEEFMREIRDDLAKRPIRRNIVPEQFQILRALQLAAHSW
jgi:hypothetical protein